MARTASASEKTRTRRIVRQLHRLYPEADCALRHEDAFQLLVATILSAQCTDERVNRTTPLLFRRYPDAAALAGAEREELQQLIRPTGFFRQKAKSLLDLARALVVDHDGLVPDRIEELVRLPGVGRKTANVVLGTWYGRPAIPVDTHVKRLASRLGLARERKDPVKIELELQGLIDESEWTFASHALIWHGRSVCKARRPACHACGLRQDCPHPD